MGVSLQYVIVVLLNVIEILLGSNFQKHLKSPSTDRDDLNFLPFVIVVF